MHRCMRAAMLAAVCVVTLAACGGTAPPAVSPSATPSVTTRATQARAEVEAAIAVCHQVITSAAVMVRDYNAFIARLNQTHDYAAIGTEDRYAVETLDAGVEQIRKALTPAVPSDLERKVQDLITATGQLSEQIGKRRKLSLNSAMDRWSDQRTVVIDSCGAFMPTGTS